MVRVNLNAAIIILSIDLVFGPKIVIFALLYPTGYKGK